MELLKVARPQPDSIEKDPGAGVHLSRQSFCQCFNDSKTGKPLFGPRAWCLFKKSMHVEVHSKSLPE